MSASTTDLTGFAHRATKGNWIDTLLAAIVSAVARHNPAKLIMKLVGLLFIVAGFLLGVIALAGIPKYGLSGVLAPALVGIVCNGLLIFIFVTNLLAASKGASCGKGRR